MTDPTPDGAPTIGPAAVRSTTRTTAIAAVLADPDVPGSAWVPTMADRTMIATQVRVTYVSRGQDTAAEIDEIVVTGARMRRDGTPGTTGDTVRSGTLSDFPDWIQTWVRGQRPRTPVLARGADMTGGNRGEVRERE